MTDKELNDNIALVKRYIAQGRLCDAFRSLRDISEKNLRWETTQELNSLEESYRLMLDYAAKGADDSGRDALYASIADKLATCADRLSRDGLKRDTPTLYFNTLRYEALQRGDSIAALIDAYGRLTEDSSLFNLIADGGTIDSARADEKEKESIEKRLFDRIWVSFPLHPESAAAITEALKSDKYQVSFKRLIICALLLGELSYHDERRLMSLMDAYDSGSDATLSLAALVALLIGLYIHSDRRFSPALAHRFEAICEAPHWHNDTKMAFLELIKTRDTERITRKMRDEVIPQMLKIKPDLSKRLSGDNTIDLGELEENPEWQEMLEKSGITDKLKELSELQEEGADVFMAAFAQLKSFPFFSDVVNWFRQFQPENSAVAEVAFDGSDQLMELVAMSPVLCNSDKYSFALSLKSLPEQQRTLMSSQLQAQSSQLEELRLATEVSALSDRRTIISMFVRDLYRFFKLFRRKGEFVDPFATDLNLSAVEPLSSQIDDAETLGLVAEFYFKRHYWREAKAMFDKIADKLPPSAQIFQKTGYCLYKTGDIHGALLQFEQAELINAENHWTLRRIAACHRLLGDLDKALQYYRRLEPHYPDDFKLVMNIGQLLMELGREPEAVNYFYKADYLSPDSVKAMRPLAWCLMATRDFDASRKYYSRIIAADPTARDYVNLAHLSLADGDFSGAFNNYREALRLTAGGTESLISEIKADEELLTRLGADKSLIPLIIDSILYASDESRG